MNEPKEYLYKISIENLADKNEEEKLINILKEIPGRQRFDIIAENKTVRIFSPDELDIETLKNQLSAKGFKIGMASETGAAKIPAQPTAAKEVKFAVKIDGMTCRSCELLIERSWKTLEGIKDVQVNLNNGTANITTNGRHVKLTELQHALNGQKYKIREFHESPNTQHDSLNTGHNPRPTFTQLIGLFALIIFIGIILSQTGILKNSFNISGSMSFGAVFLIGLVAASSSCVAISGGLLLSSAAKFNQRYAAQTKGQKMKPVLMFIAGRVAGYGLFGGILGIVGQALTPSPFFTGAIAIAAAFYMIIMGLDMLGRAPQWAKKLLPGTPKSLSHKIMDAQEKEHPVMPAALGAATFFLPCGFTQALQLYALTTGSFASGALTLFAFALGTVPALLALGWASSSLKGNFSKFFFNFSGALVIILGLWSVQNGLTIMGYPLSLPKLTSETSATAGEDQAQDNSDVRVIKMAVTDQYEPDHFTLKTGQRVRWEVDGSNIQGCGQVLMSRKLGIQQLLKPGINIINFTPKSAGEITFSCSMGMYRGSFTVVD